ncbi:LOW QUALITY PROTEIN: putative gustatory receptor 57a [Drosophila eugracilis]|uniref:LOW QUALITY PROTEIN: putative gustatory receptor 57a n=1 Tax=Drosophila eugracilis TaxID=29029 RepID=UPI001BDAEEE5|nr:LOW QUALITY PROTEIN: putative gustatory receptor 57a [Drosophila eugracilis]
MAVLYFFREPKTIFDCAGFICCLQFIMGCNGFSVIGSRFKINLWRRIYSLSVAIFALFGLFGSLLALLAAEDLKERIEKADNLVLSISVLELVMSTLVFLGTVLSLQISARQHLGIYLRLAALDDRLVSHFGANLNYRKMMRKNIVVLGLVSLIYMVAINSAAILVGNGHRALFLLFALCYTIVTGGPHFTGYVHMTLAEMLGIRFRLLQQMLSPEFLKWRFPQMNVREIRIRQVVSMIQELHQLVQEINRVYAFSLWLAMAHDLAMSTSELYILFGQSVGIGGGVQQDEDNEERITSFRMLGYIALCMLPPLYKLLIAPFYCDRTIREARKCLRLVEQLDNWFPEKNSMRPLVESLMAWRLQAKIQFTGGMDVVLNRKIIGLFTSILVNYLLILIQFAMTQKMGEQIEQQKIALQEWIGY